MVAYGCICTHWTCILSRAQTLIHMYTHHSTYRVMRVDMHNITINERSLGSVQFQRHTFEHPMQKTNYLKAEKDWLLSCWDDLQKIINKLSFTHSTSCLPKPKLLQTVLRSSAMTSWSRFLSCAHKAAESENPGYLNIYGHTQRHCPYRSLCPPLTATSTADLLPVLSMIYCLIWLWWNIVGHQQK